MGVIKDGQRFLEVRKNKNGKAKKGTNKTKHTKPEIYSTELIHELNGMV